MRLASSNASLPMRHRSHRVAVGLAALLLTTALAACGDDDEAASPPTTAEATSTEATFPVTIEHALGATTIEEAPERVVTWGFASADAAIAMGVIPVAIPFQEYGGDAEGVLPWIREALDEAGADLPTILPNVQELPFEAITAADPDLILAPYSGITQGEYDLLAQIAPTVAYPDEAWSTPWRETIEIVGKALGRPDEAEEVLDGIDDAVADAAAAHQELKGTTVALVWDTPDAFYVYKPADSRVAFTLDLGLDSAPAVEALSSGDSTFYFTLSKERLGELTSDILVSYADSPEQSAAFLASDAAKLMPQVQRGAVAQVVGKEFIAAVSPPTALSLTWGLDEYVALLSGAAASAAG